MLLLFLKSANHNEKNKHEINISNTVYLRIYIDTVLETKQVPILKYDSRSRKQQKVGKKTQSETKKDYKKHFSNN